jgi:methionine-rich copper-binding protein CopC
MPRKQAQSRWARLSNVHKYLVMGGAVAAAIVVISQATTVAHTMFEHQRPWARRQIEVIVAGLQIESLRSKEAQNRYQIFQLEDEQRQQQQRFPQWKEELLRKIKWEQEQLQKYILELEKTK